ncbi:MAG: metallophosphoesterase [Prolixibacteraceae bacterium]|nr:metallophosphoesterase [Prolixibacteraceae bacterium]
MYDIIGDLHGHYDLLVKLLDKMGYEPDDKSFKHPLRKVIFAGDFINRGPKIRATVRLVKQMVESGQAHAVIGNHELNAILYSTIDKSGKSLRKHLPKYKLPLMKTLDEYKKHTDEFKETIQWFRHLPLYLDLGDLRVVHGGWNKQHIKTFEDHLNGESKLKKSLLKEYLAGNVLTEAMDGLLKGKEFKLPSDLLLKDNKGIVRRNFRMKWWDEPEGKTFNDIAFGNRFSLPEYTIPSELLPDVTPYSADDPPVFMGHYCLEQRAEIFQGNICCIDSCVVRSQVLSAYRWDGENKLDESKLIQSD